MNASPAPLISVLLPVRNGEKTLGAALRSLQAQSFDDFEIILLDDGSTDGTTAVVQGLADPRIRLISDGTGKGLAARLNQGIELARGALIARMDADDLCFPSRFQRQVEFLQTNPGVDLVAGRALVFADGDHSVIGLIPLRESHEEITAQPWRGMFLPHPCWMGRREWFLRHRYRFPEVMRAEDQELLLRAMPESRYHCLPDVLLAYRQGDYRFGRVWVARRSLLAAQLGLFRRRGQWGAAAVALGMFGAKVAADFLAGLPGADSLFFRRMGEPVPPAVMDEFRTLLMETGAGDAA